MKPKRREIRFAVFRLRGDTDGGLSRYQAKRIINAVSDKEILDAGFYSIKEIRRLAE